MTARFPSFDLTPAETASLEAAVVDLLAEGARRLHRPGPLLGRHDYAAALRLVRDASAYSGDLLAETAGEDKDAEEEEEEGKNGAKKKATKGNRTRESTYPASCALLKGDALRGLGRLPEAAAAYREAATAYAVDGPLVVSRPSRRDDDDEDEDEHIDRSAARMAARHLADLGGRCLAGPPPRRAGGLWNAHDVAGARHRADEDGEGRRGGGRAGEAALRGGRRAEYWDPEPALVVRSVTRHKPVLTLVDRPATRAAAGAVPAVVVDAATAIGSSRRKHPMPSPPSSTTMTMTMTTTTTTWPSTSSGRLGGGGGSWLPSGNPRLAAAAAPAASPLSQEKPPRRLRRRKSTSQNLKAILQAQAGDQLGR